MLEQIVEKTNQYIEEMPKKERKNTDSSLRALKQLDIWLDCLLYWSRLQ